MTFWVWFGIALTIVGAYVLTIAMMKAASDADDIDEGDD